MLWGYEEFKHYTALRTYLQSPALESFVDMEDFDRELKAARSGEWGNKERGYTPLQIPFYRGVQEIFTGVFYEAWGRNTEEPVRQATSIGVGDALRVIRRISRIVGKAHMLELAGSKAFRNKVSDYNLDPAEVVRHFVLGR